MVVGEYVEDDLATLAPNLPLSVNVSEDSKLDGEGVFAAI